MNTSDHSHEAREWAHNHARSVAASAFEDIDTHHAGGNTFAAVGFLPGGSSIGVTVTVEREDCDAGTGIGAFAHSSIVSADVEGPDGRIEWIAHTHSLVADLLQTLDDNGWIDAWRAYHA